MGLRDRLGCDDLFQGAHIADRQLPQTQNQLMWSRVPQLLTEVWNLLVCVCVWGCNLKPYTGL